MILAMDVSRSMKATDVEPTRLDAARAAAEAFLAQVPEKFRVGVVSFATQRSRRRATDARPRAGGGRRSTRSRPARARRSATRWRSPSGSGSDSGAARTRSCRHARSCSSPTAPATAGASTRRRPPRRQRSSGIPVHTVLVGTPEGVVEETLTGGFRQHHPRAAEPGDARRRCPRRRAASSSPRPTTSACARSTRSWAPGSASATSRERSRTCSRPARPCSCSWAERCRRSSSRGFRETRPAHRRRWRPRSRRRSSRRRPPGARTSATGCRCACRSRGRGSRAELGRTVAPRVEWQLTCPRGYIVGGLDAELTHRAIDVSFLGRLGQPGQPRDHDVARGDLRRDVRRSDRPARASFKPYIGCMPAQRRRLPGADLRSGVPAGPAGDTAREDGAGASRKRHRHAGVPCRRASRRSVACVRLLHAHAAERKPRRRASPARSSVRGGTVARPRARRRRARRSPRGGPGAGRVREGAMSFQSPWLLLSLLVLAAAVGVWLLRGAAAYALRGPVHEHGRARAPSSPGGAWPRLVPPALFALALAVLLVGAGATPGRADGLDGARDGDPRHRHVTVDAGAGRRADEARAPPRRRCARSSTRHPIACGSASSSSRERRRSQLRRPAITISSARPSTRSTPS